MTRAEYLALAERAERAEGADRELDGEIAVALHGGDIVWKVANGTMEQYPVHRYRSPNHVSGFANAPVPSFTASLDAALSLVPEGRIVRLLMDPDGRSAAYVNHPGQIADRRLAATPALALVAAALRARAEEAKDGE